MGNLKNDDVPLIVCNTLGGHEVSRLEAIVRDRAKRENVTFTVIDGVVVLLPSEAKYVMQDKYARWFFSEKYPVDSKNDWFADKRPIQYCKNGQTCLLTSQPNKDWRETRSKTTYIDSKH